MHGAIEEVEQRRQEFLDRYEELVEKAPDVLGGMFNRDDFPSLSELKRKFGVSYEILPVPSAAHFVADVGDAEAERIRADLERRNQAKLDAAMVHVQEKIEELLRRLIERLGTDEEGNPKKVHESTLESLKEFVDAVPSLNLSDDKRLTEIAARIRKVIGTLTIDDLRYKSKKPAAIEATTRRRHGFSQELDALASMYFGPPVETAPVGGESTAK